MPDFIDVLQSYQQPCISEQELTQLYFSQNKEATEASLFWDIQDLKRQNYLIPCAEGFRIQRIFKPVLDSSVLKTYHTLQESLPDVSFCIWQTAWLNSFSRHQSPQTITVLEVDKDLGETVFFTLKDSGWQEVFLLLKKEDEALLERYIFESENPLVIQKQISKSPTQLVEKIRIPQLEKLLVDVFVGLPILASYPKSEHSYIFETALEEYVLDFTRLFGYAKRRGKEEELQAYLFEHFSTQIETLIR